MGECIRCSACCRILPCLTKGMAPETRQWLIARGATESEDKTYLLLPHVCPHLQQDGEPDGYFDCDIHDTPEYPKACARYHGHGAYYKPPGCGYLK